MDGDQGSMRTLSGKGLYPFCHVSVLLAGGTGSLAWGNFNYSSRPGLILYKKQVALSASNPGPMMIRPLSLQMDMGTHSATFIKNQITRAATDLELFSGRLTSCPFQILVRAHTTFDEARWGFLC